MPDDNDDGARVGLWVVLGIITLLLFGLIAGLAIRATHDPSGDATVNQELARNRARAVRAAITSQGVAADRVALRKPEQTATDGPADEARRVEIRLVD